MSIPDNFMNGEQRMVVWVAFFVAAAVTITLTTLTVIGLEETRIKQGYEQRLVYPGNGWGPRTIWQKSDTLAVRH